MLYKIKITKLMKLICNYKLIKNKFKIILMNYKKKIKSLIN